MVENRENGLDELRDTVRRSVEEKRDIQAEVREITLKALGERELDRNRIRAVAEAVMQGAGEALERESEQLKRGLGEAAAGLEEALIKAADALRLAIEEAAGRVNEFSTGDLKRSLDDLDNLEAVFLEALQRAAKGGGEMVRTIMGEMASHARNSGTSVGQHVARNMEQLHNRMRELGTETAGAGEEAANRIGQVARGILAGVAGTLLHIAEGDRRQRDGRS
ncbi:MAG TPA: hypothetical protein ENJ43_02705 [Gammaproteobacteria bacterium]|nr:hypothetical protein [Gammaproteobacteria bacterium]